MALRVHSNLFSQKNFALACIANSSQALLVMMFLFAHRAYKVYQVEKWYITPTLRNMLIMNSL